MKILTSILSLMLCAIMLCSFSACGNEPDVNSQVGEVSDIGKTHSQTSEITPNTVKLRFEKTEVPFDFTYNWGSNSFIVQDQKALDNLIDMLNNCEFVEIPKDSEEYSIFDDRKYSPAKCGSFYDFLHLDVKNETGEEVWFWLQVNGEYAHFDLKEYKIVNFDRTVFSAFSDSIMTWQEYHDETSE